MLFAVLCRSPCVLRCLLLVARISYLVRLSDGLDSRSLLERGGSTEECCVESNRRKRARRSESEVTQKDG